MGMSAEDFGAVLGELTASTDYAEKLEQDSPQRDSTRWWFSIRTHVTSHFEAREYHDWKQRGSDAHPLPAEIVWNQLHRPELRFWVLEALGLLDDPQHTYGVVMALDTCAKRNKYLKGLFDWSEIEASARCEHERLVRQLPFSHRSSS